MNTTTTVPLETQLAEVNREIAMREKVYPRWITENKITKWKADEKLANMKAVADTLRGLVAAKNPPLIA